MAYILFILVALLQLACTPACAGELQALTLHEAIVRGLERNNRVIASGHQATAARIAATAAGRHYLPTVHLEETWSRSNLPVATFMMKLNQGRFQNRDFEVERLNNPAPVSDFRTALTLEQPLLTPSAPGTAAMAREEAQSREALTEQTRQQVAFTIFQLYLEVHKAKAHRAALETALSEARERRRQATVRTAAGLGLASDELRAATHLAALEQRRISADHGLVLARMQLALATGGNPGDELDTAEAVRLQQPDRSLASLLTTARQMRPDLQAAERERERAEAALRRARSGFLPTVNAFGSWQMHDAVTPFGRDQDAWMAGVSLRWNLFDGLRTVHGVGQARAERAAATELLVGRENEVGYQVHEAWLRRIEAEQRVEVARSAVSAAAETVRLLAKRFDNALATMIEVLDAQNVLDQARAAVVESEAELHLATGRLYHVAGVFLKEVL